MEHAFHLYFPDSINMFLFYYINLHTYTHTHIKIQIVKRKENAHIYFIEKNEIKYELSGIYHKKEMICQEKQSRKDTNVNKKAKRNFKTAILSLF
jgi:hypothetical protein